MMFFGDEGTGWFCYIRFVPSSEGKVHDHRDPHYALLVTLCPKAVCFRYASVAKKMKSVYKREILDQHHAMPLAASSAWEHRE